jgi:hypothetical protein
VDIQHVPVAVRISSERERKRKQKETRNQRILSTIFLVLVGALIAAILDLLLVILIIAVPASAFNWLPASIFSALSSLDWRLIESEAFVNSILGVAIGIVLWKMLGQKKQNTITESEAVIRYDHLRAVERKDNPYIINLDEKAGYKLPDWAQGLVDEGIIRQATDQEANGISWNETEARTRQLGLTHAKSIKGEEVKD